MAKNIIKKKKSGFSILELLVVITILAILIAIFVFGYRSYEVNFNIQRAGVFVLRDFRYAVTKAITESKDYKIEMKRDSYKIYKLREEFPDPLDLNKIILKDVMIKDVKMEHIFGDGIEFVFSDGTDDTPPDPPTITTRDYIINLPQNLKPEDFCPFTLTVDSSTEPVRDNNYRFLYITSKRTSKYMRISFDGKIGGFKLFVLNSKNSSVEEIYD